jgi:hypothetical protein
MSPKETIGDALIEDGSAGHVLENAVIVDQIHESSEETPAAASTTSVDISIMETTVASSATPVLEPELDAPAEPGQDAGTPAPPPTPAIMWNKMPSNHPSCLGTGYFPFDRGTEDPPQYVVHDIELRGRVTTCNILARPQYTHTLDVTLTDADIARIQAFVLSSSKVLPSSVTGFKWTINSSAMTIRFANKKDVSMEFEPVWDARGRDEDLWYDLNTRVYISAKEIKCDSRVMVEAIPEIWQRPDGERVAMGCTMHLTAIGLVEDGPPPPVKCEDMTNYNFTSPKKRCVRPFTQREVT